MSISGLAAIIITVYNKEDYVAETIYSAIKQTYKNIEIIIVDDGSTDNSLNIMEKIAENDLRVKIVNQENKGPASARNRGIKLVKGEYINFLDGDDLLYPRFVEETIKFLKENPKVDIVHTSWDLLDNSGNKTAAKIAPHSDDYLHDLLLSNMFATHALMFRKNIIEKAGLMLDIKTEDWEYWVRCAKIGARFKELKKVLATIVPVPDSDHIIIPDQEKRFFQVINEIYDCTLEQKYAELKIVTIIRRHLYVLEDYIARNIDGEVNKKIDFVSQLIRDNKLSLRETKYLIGSLYQLPLNIAFRLSQHIAFSAYHKNKLKQKYYMGYLINKMVINRIKIYIKKLYAFLIKKNH